MVRMGTLPFRLLCLSYGCDLAYTEEIICHKLIASFRTINPKSKTIEFVAKKLISKNSNSLDIDEKIHESNPSIPYPRHTIALSTVSEDHPTSCQIGAPNGSLALKSAMVVINDFDVIDINCGCPKGYSIKGGMGAALLKDVNNLTDLLKTLTRNLPKPVTAKIRILDNIKETIHLVKALESTGISALGVHARTTPMRPQEPALKEYFPILQSSLSIPLIANGDLYSFEDIQELRKHGVSSFMFARGAIRNPAIFLSKSKPQSVKILEVLNSFVQYSISTDNSFHNTKYILHRIAASNSLLKKPPVNGWFNAKSWDEFLPIWNLSKISTLPTT